MPLIQRQLQVNVTGGNFAFGGTAPNLNGLRTSVHVTCNGGRELTQADILIYGMRLQDMNSLSTLGQIGLVLTSNTVTVTAIDDRGSNLVFTGNIYSAISDFQGGPNLPFHILAMGELKSATQNMQGTSFKGSTDVNQMLQTLAGQMGSQFESHISGIKLMNPWYAQSPLNQIRQICEDCNLNFVAPDNKGTVSAWPLNGFRNSGLTITPTTGLVGYPSYSSYGIKLKMIFQPSINYGDQITVAGSAIQQANGSWTIWRLEHILESYKPNGQWFTVVEANRTGSGPPSQ